MPSATDIGKIKVLTDAQLRLTSNTTLQGAAQNKGTATNLLLTIIGAGDGANPVAGTTTVTIQGSNSTVAASFLGAGSSITPDKGTVANITVAGTQVVHLAQLQYQFYRVALSAASASTSSTTAVWDFLPVEDSADATQQ